MRSAIAVGLVLAACTGCTGAPAPEDAGLDAGAPPDVSTFSVAEPAPPLDPEPPALPLLGPCAPGWLERSPVREGMPATCDPWGPEGRARCADHEPQMPGDSACTRLGAPCPMGQFPAGLPVDRPHLYVLAGAAPGGTGAIDAPFATISAAVAAARLSGAPAIIAVGRGDYAETVRLTAGLELRGACVEQTRLLGAPGAIVALELAGAGVEVRDLTIAGAANGVTTAETIATTARLEGVSIRDVDFIGLNVVGTATIAMVRSSIARAGDTGILLLGAAVVELDLVELSVIGSSGIEARELSRARLRDTVIADVGITLRSNEPSDGIYVFGRPIVTLERSIIERVATGGLAVTAGSVELTDSIVRGTVDPSNSDAILVFPPSSVRLRRVMFEDYAQNAINVAGSGSSLSFEDVVVLRTPDPTSFEAVSVSEAAAIDGKRLAIWGGSGGLLVANAGTDARLSDVTVLDLLEREDRASYALAVVDEASVHLTRGRFSDGGGSAIGMNVGGARRVLEDVIVERWTSSRRSSGQGLILTEGAALTLKRARFSETAIGGINLFASSLIAEDVRVGDISGADRPPSISDPYDGLFGEGVVIGNGSTLALERAVIERSREHGMFVYGSRVMLEDVAITDTRSDSFGQVGRGLVTITSTITGARLLISGNGDISLGVADGASARLSDVSLMRTRSTICRVETCGVLVEDTGVGLSVIGGDVEIERFLIAEHALAGVQIADPSSRLVLRQGRVIDNPIGVHIGVPGFDSASITMEVIYDNRLNTSSSGAFYLPVFMTPSFD